MDVELKLPPVLQQGVAAMKAIATRVANAQLECGLNIPVDIYLRFYFLDKEESAERKKKRQEH